MGAHLSSQSLVLSFGCVAAYACVADLIVFAFYLRVRTRSRAQFVQGKHMEEEL